MILNRYLFKEIFKVQLVTFTILLSVFLCQSVIRYVSRAAAGDTPSDVIFSMVAYSIPSICYLMLPLSLFVAVLSAIGRISSDSEMVVMRSVGYSGLNILWIAMALAAITAVISACNSFYFMPEAAKAQQILASAAKNNPKYLPIESGRFVNFANGNASYVIYIENVQGRKVQDKRMGNIYVLSNPFSNSDSAFTAAVSGNVTSDGDGYQWLNLGQGNRYEGPLANNGGYRDFSFDSFRLPIGFYEEDRMEENDISTVSTLDLIKADDKASRLELQWRVAPIIAVFILTMIAVPLSIVNPRQGRFSRLWQSIMIYVAYYLLLLSCRNMINAERLWVLPGLYLVPVVFALVVALPLNLRGNLRIKRKRVRRG